jgi:predicted branched-subunit amino acid permease
LIIVKEKFAHNEFGKIYTVISIPDMERVKEVEFMMAALFLLFLISQFLIFRGKKRPAIVLALVTLVLCLFMYIHHITLSIPIRL